jgi:HNH endonuclease
MSFTEVWKTNVPYRITSKIAIGGPDDCWLWKGCVIQAGHGQVHWQGKTVMVHRVVYQLTKGEIPEGIEVMHKCNNPPCLNPVHLELGTHAENQAYMGACGRAGTKKVGESGLQGVTWLHGYWVARGTRNSTRIHLYHGKDFFEACCARKSWEARRNLA